MKEKFIILVIVVIALLYIALGILTLTQNRIATAIGAIILVIDGVAAFGCSLYILILEYLQKN